MDKTKRGLGEKPGSMEGLRSKSQPTGAATAPGKVGGELDAALLREELAALRRELSALEGYRDSYERLLSTLDANHSLFLAGDPEALSRHLLALVRDLMAADRVALFRLDEQGGLYLARQDPVDVEFAAISHSIVRDALREKQSRYHLGELAEGIERQSVLDLALGTVVATPLMAADRLIGVLYLDARAVGQLDRRDIRLLETFARVSAAAHLRVEELRDLRDRESRLTEERAALETQVSGLARFGNLIAESAAMRAVIGKLRAMARVRSTVRIQGETGTGKELVARALHNESPWSKGPFVAVNCAAIPETLLESELFGHARGAFTGADRERRGLFEQADGGTLFLDEIGDLPLSLQVKLLRVLENSGFRRLGEERDRRVDLRLVVATHRDLREMVRKGDFREDLFYRLDVLGVEIPPLRARPEDIPVLAEHFLADDCGDGPPPRLSAGARRRLMGRRWPGNVRQLEKCIERSLALRQAGGDLQEKDVLLDEVELATESADIDPAESLREFTSRMETRKIQAALDAVAWNVTRAAAALGISRQYLHEKIRRLGLRESSATKDTSR